MAKKARANESSISYVKKSMREAMAVTGYLEEALVDKIALMEQVELRPELEVEDVFIRVRGSQIEEVRVGSAKKGWTLVQLILREGAITETAVRVGTSNSGMKAYHDPVLNRVRQEATAKKIML
jgi:hypothetical protein